MFLSHLKTLKLLRRKESSPLPSHPGTNIVADLVKNADDGVTACIVALQKNEISAIRTEAHLRFVTELLGYSLRLSFTPLNK